LEQYHFTRPLTTSVTEIYTDTRCQLQEHRVPEFHRHHGDDRCTGVECEFPGPFLALFWLIPRFARPGTPRAASLFFSSQNALHQICFHQAWRQKALTRRLISQSGRADWYRRFQRTRLETAHLNSVENIDKLVTGLSTTPFWSRRRGGRAVAS
jgi:hypothetical protein